MEGLLNVYTLAQLLSISPWTVRSYVKQGKLRPIRVGRRVLFEENELERFLAMCRRASNHEVGSLQALGVSNGQ